MAGMNRRYWQHEKSVWYIILPNNSLAACRRQRNVIWTRTVRRATTASCHFRRAWWNFSPPQTISNERQRQLGLAAEDWSGPVRPGPARAVSDRYGQWTERLTNERTDEVIEPPARQLRESIISEDGEKKRQQIPVNISCLPHSPTRRVTLWGSWV